jgi:hypothetical protein
LTFASPPGFPHPAALITPKWVFWTPPVVAAFATGGLTALSDLKSEAAVKLLGQTEIERGQPS